MVRDDLRAMTPRLRRYARALASGGAGPCDIADSLVHATLMRAIGSRGVGSPSDMPIRLFATVTQLHRDLVPAARPSSVGPASSTTTAAARDLVPARHDGLATALLRLPLEEREALLLVVLERFDHATAARILRISRPMLFERLTRARRALGEPCEAAAPVAAAGASRAATNVPYLRLVVG